MFRVTYNGQHGASCTYYMQTEDATLKFLSKLRREAQVFDETGQEVGGIERKPRGYFDDKRICWFWWLEVEETK